MKIIKTHRIGHVSNKIILLLGALLFIFGIISICISIPQIIKKSKFNTKLFISASVFPSSKIKLTHTAEIFEDPEIPDFIEHTQITSGDNSSSSNIEEKHSPDEKVFKIIESQLGASGKKYKNFYLKKDVDCDISIEKECEKRPDIKIKKHGPAQVLIYHTHTTESYINFDKGFYYESFYPRSTDPKHNVTAVGKSIKDVLMSNGITTIHDTTIHDNPSYSGSYSRSADTIKKNLEKHPSISVTIDIHRDSLGDNDTGKIKPTFKFNNQKAAQIMVMAGCDIDGSLEFPDWEYNLRFALKIQETAEKMYPGMTRPMYFGDVKYNMNLTHGSVLIEVGSDVNTLEEAKLSGTLLGNVLAKVLSEYQR